MYVAVCEASGTKVIAGRYPTTWELNQGIEDYEMYIIKQAGGGRAIDLDDWGKAHDGNTLHTQIQDDWLACKRWKFERLSDDTGEEEQKLLKDIESKNKQVAEQDEKIKEQAAQLNDKNNQLAELKARLASQDEELSKVKLDLNRQSTLLVQTQDVLHRASESLATQGTDLLRTEVWDNQSRTNNELSQQKERQKKLQEKVEGLERMIAEVHYSKRM
ncbi:hypothetical protein FRC07_006337 [Ceratobasidium sp. 392]|nr:hypothetical protein FRC07_006337 [Ceratobasidium sp. 392]